MAKKEKEKVKEKKESSLEGLKAGWSALSEQSRRILLIVGGCALAFVVIGCILLAASGNSSKKNYETLFTGLSQSDASNVISYLGTQNIDYTYDPESGVITVPADVADQVRAEVFSQGYVKESGFTYDVYINNSGMMTTETDKQLYSIYDLQDRLGATIKKFDGVQDAKVTIAEGQTSDYVLSDESDNTASTASVVVTMQPGKELTSENASAIRNLIAHSVQGMEFTNVSVFDAATMTEVGSSAEDDTNTQLQELTSQVESSIAEKVRNVLGKIYGTENVEVEVRGTLDPSSLVSESTQYTVPAQTDETDRTGLLDSETVTSQYEGTSEENAAGVAGADANADTPSYTTIDGTSTDSNAAGYSTQEYQYLYNILKEQKITDPGTLSDLSVAVVIDTADMTIASDDLVTLIADASGISRSRAQDKITVLRTGVDPSTAAADTTTAQTTTDTTPWYMNRQFLQIAAIALGIILLLILLLIISAKRRKKLKKKAAEELEAQRREFEGAAAQSAEEAKEEKKRQLSNEELMTDRQMARGNELKDQIGGFVDDNPQIAARLIEDWLREEGNNGRSQRRTR